MYTNSSKITLTLPQWAIDRPVPSIVHRWQSLACMRPMLEKDPRSFEEITAVRRGTPAVGPSTRVNEEAAYGTTTL
jgi:hypothetical protein